MAKECNATRHAFATTCHDRWCSSHMDGCRFTSDGCRGRWRTSEVPAQEIETRSSLRIPFVQDVQHKKHGPTSMLRARMGSMQFMERNCWESYPCHRRTKDDMIMDALESNTH